MVPSPESCSALYILVDNGSFLNSKRMLLQFTSLSKAFCPKRQLSNHQSLWLKSSCMRLATIPTVGSSIVEEENSLNSHKIYIKKKNAVIELTSTQLSMGGDNITKWSSFLYYTTLFLSNVVSQYFFFPEERTMQNITECTGSTSF